MPVLRNTPNTGGQSKKTMQSDDTQVGVVQPTNNTAQVEEQLSLPQPTQVLCSLLHQELNPMIK